MAIRKRLLWSWPGHGLTLYFEPRDVWVGLYWDVAWEGRERNLYLYVCPVPLLVVKWALVIGRASDGE